MFEKHFDREYEIIDFPYFVSKEELEYNIEWTKQLVDDKWVYYRWREDVTYGGWKRNEDVAEKIAKHGGLNLEICAGPGGGFMPATLMKNYDANIMISDLCPSVVKEWFNLFKEMDNPPPNIEYAVFDVCDLPFEDNSIDVISGSAAIINIEGERDKALKEIYRVLKPGGMFIFDYIFVTEEYYNQLPVKARETIKERFPTAFWDQLNIFDNLGYSNMETIKKSEWSNKDDDSTLASLCRSFNVELNFSCFVRYCIK